MSFTIRRTVTEAIDPVVLAEILHHSVHGLAGRSYDAAQLAAWSPQPMEREHARQRFAGQNLWLAEDAEGVCAFMTLTDEGYLDFAYALPRIAGQGAAAMIYDDLEAFAAEEGMIVLTSDVSIIAQPFFAARGWKSVREQIVTRNGVTLSNVHMEKELAA